METGGWRLGGILNAYVTGTAGDFFATHYANAGDRRSAVARAARPLPPGVADALEAQNARLAPSRARDAYLAALRRGAAAVVTGQQVGLFLGPLFTTYKAATAVSVARALAAESGRPVVPIFWLQTEDHDLPEIAQCHLPSPRGPHAIRLPVPAENRISVAHLSLPESVSACLAEVGAALGGLPHASPHLERLARHYRPGAGWTEAFAGLLAELFAEAGLVLMDPRDRALASTAAPIHERALRDAEPIAAMLDQRTQALIAAGFAATVHVRAGAPLSFFHPEGPRGPRYRLAPVPDGFTEVGGRHTHTLAALRAALDTDPLRYSASALLRPIVQDSLLPVAAYVAGPGEVAYFAQLAPLYAAYDLAMPLLVPRASFRVLGEETLRLLARFTLEAADLERPEHELLAAAGAGAHAPADGAALTHRLLAPFEAALAEISPSLERIGPGLPTAIEKTRHSVERAVGRLVDKYETARLHQDSTIVKEVRRLKQLLYPHDTPQERVYGFPYVAARYGEHAFVERVLAAVVPFDVAPRDLPLPSAPVRSSPDHC